MKDKIIEIFKEMLNEFVNDQRLRSEDAIYDDYATRIDSLYSGNKGVSEDLIKSLTKIHLQLIEGKLKNPRNALGALIYTLESHPTPEISEEEIKNIVYEKIAGWMHSDRSAWRATKSITEALIEKLTLSKGAKPISEERIDEVFAKNSESLALMGGDGYSRQLLDYPHFKAALKELNK